MQHYINKCNKKDIGEIAPYYCISIITNFYNTVYSYTDASICCVRKQVFSYYYTGSMVNISVKCLWQISYDLDHVIMCPVMSICCACVSHMPRRC